MAPLAFIILTLLTAEPATAQPGYAAAGKCASCHSEIAAAYAQTGMARSFKTLTASDWITGSFTNEASRQQFSAEKRDGRFYLRRGQQGSSDAVEKEAHYVFGSGNHARSYLHRSPAGRLIELPLTYYTSPGAWAMSPAFDRPDHPGFTREISYECMFCHNAYPQLASSADFPGNSAVFPTQLPQGIDCQRCHGPGAHHIAAAERSAPPAEIRNAIVNPKRLTPARQLEICMQCHLETTSLALPSSLTRFGRGVFSYRPTEPLDDYILHFTTSALDKEEGIELVSAAYRLRQSKCFQSATLTCTTCHDPHKAQRGPSSKAHFDTVCRNCHASLKAAAGHESGTGCVSCHMLQRRAADVIHVSAMDHRIERHPSPEPKTPSLERHDGSHPPYRGEVLVYYPPALPQTPENVLATAVAQVKHQTNLEPGIARLERAITQFQPAASEPYFELAEALRKSGRHDRALPFYEQAVKRQPQRWLPYYGYALALIAARQEFKAIATLQTAIRLAPNEPKLFYAQGTAQAALKKSEAVQSFRQSLKLDPDQADVWNNLSSSLILQQDKNGAEAALRMAIRIRPDLTAARLNLVNLLYSSGRKPEVEPLLLEAFRINEALLLSPGMLDHKPQLEAELARAHLAYGILLAEQNMIDAAFDHFKIAATSRESEVRQFAEQLLNLRRQQ